jgi:hypothetical protein
MLKIFSSEKSDGFGRVWTRELGYQFLSELLQRQYGRRQVMERMV